ncbi:MAG: ABC transporter permease [bacterium]|nr:ABC transporter permease [bacterium]
MFNLMQSMQQALGLLLKFDPEIWQIVFLSLQVSFASSLIAVVLAVPLSLAITQNEFRGKRIVIGTVNSFIAIPAVVIGLVCYLLLSRSGPLGFWHLLYTPSAIIIAQTLLIIPLMTGLSISALQSLGHRVKETMITLGAGRWHLILGIMREVRFALAAAFITGFSRVLGETGMTMMVGGNIMGDTRVMTTAIALETIKGNFELGIALGLVLLIVAIGINIILQTVQGRAGR